MPEHIVEEDQIRVSLLTMLKKKSVQPNTMIFSSVAAWSSGSTSSCFWQCKTAALACSTYEGSVELFSLRMMMRV